LSWYYDDDDDDDYYSYDGGKGCHMSRALGSELIPVTCHSVLHKPGGRLSLLSARPTVTFPAKEITAPWSLPNYTA